MTTINFGTPDKWLLIGGGELLLWCKEELERLGETVVAVTSPRQADDTPGIRVIRSLDEICDEITPTTIGLSIGSAWIFKQEFIDLFGGKLLNMHNALLPQNRGAGGVSWRIMMNTPVDGCTLHQIEAEIDTGAVVKQREFRITSDYAYQSPENYISYCMPEYEIMLAEFLSAVVAGREFELMQQHQLDVGSPTYWPRLNTERQAYINWNWTAQEIARFICAFDEPYVGAATFFDYAPFGLVRFKCCYKWQETQFHPFQTGLVYRKAKSNYDMSVAANGGTLLIQSVTFEDGTDAMPHISLGDRFFTPQKYLERMWYRPTYTPEGLK